MTASESSPIYEFADFRLDPRRRSLIRKSGERIELTGKVLDALIYLVEHAGELVPRASLMKALWPATVVEDNSLTQVISTLRRALGDDQGRRLLIATVSGRGYQFVGHVRASPAESTEPAVERLPPASKTVTGRFRQERLSWLRRSIVLGVAAMGLIAIGAVALRYYAANMRDAPEGMQSSLAVLPFRNLSSDPGDAHFAAGLHEEVLSRLSRIRSLTLIGRTSVMSYEDDARPTSDIARELRVGAVLEGSAARAGDQVRVSVRLVAADTGAVLWSELYDGALGDVFGIQADIATKIAGALEARLSPDERSRVKRRPTQSLEAYALHLRAIALYRAAGGIGPAMPAAARAEMQSYFDRAIALDAGFAEAYAWKAYIYVDSLFFDSVPEHDWASRSAEWMELVEANAEQALSLDAEASVAHVAKARLELFRARLAEARAALEHARASNPNDSQALQQTALLYSLLGDFRQAIAAAQRALAVDPKNPGSYGPLAVALQLSGQHAAASETAENMIAAAPGAAIAYVLLARSEIARGDLGKALEALKLAEPLGSQSPTSAIDLAVIHRRLGQTAEAERLAGLFLASTRGLYVSPALQVTEALARGDHETAFRRAQIAFASRALGADPLALAAIQWNIWSDPVLDQPPWRELRREMAERD